MIDDELTKLQGLCDNATPGPWSNDVSYGEYGVKSKKCFLCGRDDSPVVGTRPAVAHEIETNGCKQYHTHEYPNSKWHDISSKSTFERITGNYDYEEGGVCSSKADSDFIAAAREAVPQLLAEVKRLRDALGECD
jgi:hypothetical protein